MINFILREKRISEAVIETKVLYFLLVYYISIYFTLINLTVSGRFECAYNVSQLVTKLLIQDALPYEIFEQCLTCEWMNKTRKDHNY